MERLMQYVWQHKLWPAEEMKTVDGRQVRVIDQGLINTGAGPDFFNAKVMIDRQLWSGNVEIHVRASDWFRHGHDKDSAYDSVVLHVVASSDAEIHRPDGQLVPQMVMDCTPDFSRRYREMVEGCRDFPPCRKEIPALPSIYIHDWIDNLAYERINAKVERISRLVAGHDGNWIDAVYITLARALGFGTNSDAFERLALSTPLKMLLKHRDSLETIEGTLFGQAGFLDNPPERAGYVERMIQEYSFMASKFGLARSLALNWRMSGRPANFPHRRISTLAHMINAGFVIGSRIFEVKNEADARSLFDISLTGFWSRRYTFMAEASPTVKALSDASVSILIINVVAPMLYAYGVAYNDPQRCQTALELLQGLPPERNNIVRQFTDAGIPCADAFTSQALIELCRSYCEQRKCLYCRIGHRLLSAKVKR